MDYQWFDDLTRSAASCVSRRQSLRLLGSSLVGGILGVLGGRTASHNPYSIGLGPSAFADDRPIHPDIDPRTLELLPYRDTGYRFQTIPADATPPLDWEQPEFDDSGFNTGSAAFGSGGNCPLQSRVQSNWSVNSQLLARHVISVPFEAMNVRVLMSVDNDIMGVFFNGSPLVEHTLGTQTVLHDECSILDEFRFDVPPWLVEEAENVIAFYVTDRGDETFFDARILAELPIRIVASAVTCSETNIVSVPCEALNDYIENCGVVCPDGTRLRGEGGCTVCRVRPEWRSSARTFEENALGQTCASATVTADFVTVQLASTMITYQPTTPPCCAQVCADEIAEVLRQLEVHEAGHRAQYEAARREANLLWTRRSFTACSGTSTSANKALSARIRAAVQATVERIITQCKIHPPQARLIQCAKCTPARPGQRCVNGMCQASVCSRASICSRPDRRCRCNPLVDCSRGGRFCLCSRTTEGDIRCAGGVESPVDRNCGRPACTTSADCERRFGPGHFCLDPSASCCGRVCVPPC